MPLQTYGRWPLAAALSLIPVSAAALRRPALRPLAALLWPQTEEWVWPGSFLPWINREVLDSDEDEFPIDRRFGFILNVMFGWGFSLTPVLRRRAAAPATLLYVSHIGNSALHVSWAARHDPGTITSLATLTPVAITGLRSLVSDPRVSRRSLRAGATGGMVVSAALIPALKWRMRSRHTRSSAAPSM